MKNDFLPKRKSFFIKNKKRKNILTLRKNNFSQWKQFPIIKIKCFFVYNIFFLYSTNFCFSSSERFLYNSRWYCRIFSFSSLKRLWYLSQAFFVVFLCYPDNIYLINFQTFLYMWKKKKKNHKEINKKKIDFLEEL